MPPAGTEHVFGDEDYLVPSIGNESPASDVAPAWHHDRETDEAILQLAEEPEDSLFHFGDLLGELVSANPASIN